MNTFTKQDVRRKLDYMRNQADHLADFARRSGTIACLDAYTLRLYMPLNNANLIMTTYPGRD